MSLTLLRATWSCDILVDGRLALCARRFRLQIDDQATDTDAEPGQRIFQRDHGSEGEAAKRRQRSYPHDSANLRGDRGAWRPVDQIPDQGDVGRVHQKEHGRIERDWLW